MLRYDRKVFCGRVMTNGERMPALGGYSITQHVQDALSL